MASDCRDGFRGSLIGTFCGDALGMPFEGWPPEMIKKEIGEVQQMYEARLGAGTYTDDTQMMIALLESLVENEGFDGEDMALRMAKAYDPKRGYGRGTEIALKKILEGVPWEKAGKGLFKGGSYGNGAAMRIAPMGLLYFDDLKKMERMVVDSSRMTHNHPLGIEGALIQAKGVALALSKKEREELDPFSFLEEIRDLVKSKRGEWRRSLLLIEDLLENRKAGHPPSKEEVANTLGNNSSAKGSVPTALYSFLAHPKSFKEAVSYAVGLGGDTDTIGAMTGALAGAFHGLTGIPEEWYKALERGEKGREYVVEMADRLFFIRESLK